MQHQSLGDNIKPVNYSIILEPDLRTFKYLGKETIRLSIKKSTKIIKLNSKGLAIKKAVLKSKNSEQACSFTEEGADRIVVSFKEAVAGDVSLQIDFEGKALDNLTGFYRSSYTYRGKKGYLLSSHFEPDSAREAFPCFDEPEFKATFDITFIIDKDLDAISNMPVKSQKNIGKKKAVTFETTPKMSTYLVYLGVGKYDYLSDHSGRIKIRVITAPGKKHLGHVALKYTKFLITEFEKYFGIKYPLPKLDMIAVPDFSFGGMENWGAVVFRETALLCDEKKSAITAKMRIAEVIAHELCHQWFGDLVTMKWWDDLWLNESFATLLGNKIADVMVPEFNLMVDYYWSTLGTAFIEDALKATHPINVFVNTPGDVTSIFDAISYQKGGSVLFMLEDYMGEESFRKGMHNYLKANAYGNATKFDLWKAMRSASGKAGITELMTGWVDTPGYPVVHVSGENGKYSIRQSRFTISGSKMSGQWTVPIHFMGEKGDKRLLMSKTSMLLREDSSWLKLNYGQRGFYRVVYEDKIMDEVGKMIINKKLGGIDAWGVENDLFAMVRCGQAPLWRYIYFVKSYMMECEYPANFSVSGHLMWLYEMTNGMPANSEIRSVLLEFNRKMLSNIGWEKKPDESPITTRTRALAVLSLGLAGDEDTIFKANMMFEEFLKDHEAIDTNLRAAIYGTIMSSKGSEKLVEMFLKMYHEEELPEEKIRALRAMSFVRDPQLLRKVLDMSLSDKIRLQDSILLIVSIASVHSRLVLLAWMKKNWKKLMGLYSESNKMLSNTLETLSVYADKKSKDEILSFFNSKANIRDDVKRTLKQLTEYIDANIAFVKANEK